MCEIVQVKSKYEVEFCRFGLNRSDEELSQNFESFLSVIKQLHRLRSDDYQISYVDPVDNDLLPINNNENYRRALKNAKPLLRVIVHRKGQEWSGYGTMRAKHAKTLPKISNPHDFRQVSAIIDVDVVPEMCRRVRILKHGIDKPLGFYIRDGTSIRVTANGLEKQPGIFISRLVPGGLADSTGLLAVNDEVLEVNGIEVTGKTLDQVTDMMVANSSNLIVTVKPVNQKTIPSHTQRVSREYEQDDIVELEQDKDEQDDRDEVMDLLGDIPMPAESNDGLMHL